MERRFTALHIIATILKILAWISLIFGLLGGVALLILGFTLSEPLGFTGLKTGGPLAGIAAFMMILVITIIYFLFLYAGAEFIGLLLSVEENTRRIAYFSQQGYVLQQPGYPPRPLPGEYPD